MLIVGTNALVALYDSFLLLNNGLIVLINMVLPPRYLYKLIGGEGLQGFVFTKS